MSSCGVCDESCDLRRQSAALLTGRGLERQQAQLLETRDELTWHRPVGVGTQSVLLLCGQKSPALFEVHGHGDDATVGAPNARTGSGTTYRRPPPAPPANRESQCVPADGVKAARVWERAALTTIRRQAFTVPGLPTRIGASTERQRTGTTPAAWCDGFPAVDCLADEPAQGPVADVTRTLEAGHPASAGRRCAPMNRGRPRSDGSTASSNATSSRELVMRRAHGHSSWVDSSPNWSGMSVSRGGRCRHRLHRSPPAAPTRGTRPHPSAANRVRALIDQDPCARGAVSVATRGRPPRR
ncbi:hypothetical protein MLGJGCBP_07678 [Rhodococcus sp. T7]|nr:hypothetical protein MLGJGCBP_07678 [Rhodococcus sp. T7]